MNFGKNSDEVLLKLLLLLSREQILSIPISY
nr:MAG TPA: hypothetical protein [Caudoviricetes sp.]